MGFGLLYARQREAQARKDAAARAALKKRAAARPVLPTGSLAALSRPLSAPSNLIIPRDTR